MKVDATRLLSPEEIAVQAGQQTPFMRLPARTAVFNERARRLGQLAVGSAVADFLGFVAELANAQHAALQTAGDDYAVALPSQRAVEDAADNIEPLLPASSWPRDPAWRVMTRAIASHVEQQLPPGKARETAQQVAHLGDDALETQADRLLNGIMLGLDMAAAPIIAAGLQTYWTHLVLETARQHGEQAFGRIANPTRCPCCGSLPTSSITRIGGEGAGFRYLHCALCSNQWHMVRIKCAHCESTKGIHYQALEPTEGLVPATSATSVASAAVKAECCDECGHYLKTLAMERDASVEPVADDLATLTLDLLVSESGMQRHGLNLMLLFGDGGGG
jgi:FdhE protein